MHLIQLFAPCLVFVPVPPQRHRSSLLRVLIAHAFVSVQPCCCSCHCDLEVLRPRIPLSSSSLISSRTCLALISRYDVTCSSRTVACSLIDWARGQAYYDQELFSLKVINKNTISEYLIPLCTMAFQVVYFRAVRENIDEI